MRALNPLACALALVLALLVSAQITLAQGGVPTVVLTDAQGEIVADSRLQVLSDPSGRLTLQDVLSPPYAARFVPNGERAPALGLSGGVLWVRLRVQNESTRANWLLSLGDTRIPTIDIYRPNESGTDYSHIRTGDFFPYSTREISEARLTFRVATPPQGEQTIYLRIESPFSVDVPVTFWTTEAFSEYTRSEFLAYGLFYGAMLIMAGYNLFVFVALRDRTYLFLALVIFGLAASKTTNDGLGHEYLWPQFSNRWTIEYAILGTMFATSFFTTTFLGLKNRAVTLNLVFNIWRGSMLGLALVVPFTNTQPLIGILLGIELVMILVATWRAWQRGYTPARLFLLSFILPLGTSLIYVLFSLGFLPLSVLAESILLVFLAALALFWSIVLADRINLMRTEAQVAHRSLARSERQYRSLFQDSLDAVFILTREGGIVDLNPSGLDLFGYTREELGKMKAEDLFATPAEFGRLQQTLEQEGFVAEYETRLRCQDNSIITAILSSTLWHDEEHGLSGYQGILRDVTEGRRTQEELATYRLNLEELVAARTTQAQAELAERRRAESALERRVQELSALNEIAKTISTVTDLMPALELVAESVTRLFEVSCTFIGEMNHSARSLRIIAAYPPKLDGISVVGRTIAWDEAPLLYRVVEPNLPLVTSYIEANPMLGKLHELLQDQEGQTCICVPLRVSGVVNGVVLLGSPRGDRFAKGEIVNLAETVASEIATAIENTRLYQQAQATAVADERQRLARELHDSVTQLLYSIVLLAGGRSIEVEQATSERSAFGQYFTELAELGQQALGEMRLLLYQLRAPVLTKVGLGGALQQRLSAVEHRVGIQTHIYTHGDLETLPLLVQEELYFIAQEALNNALRHARASEVQVRLVKQDRHLEMVVQDNGGGFEPEVVSEGMGLRNMLARAQLIDAKLEIKSWLGKGTRVQLAKQFEQYDSG